MQAGVVAYLVLSTYRTRVIEKLSLKTNAELVRYALEHSLIE